MTACTPSVRNVAATDSSLQCVVCKSAVLIALSVYLYYIQLSTEYEALISEHGMLKSQHKQLKEEMQEVSRRKENLAREKAAIEEMRQSIHKERLSIQLDDSFSFNQDMKRLNEEKQIVSQQADKVCVVYFDFHGPTLYAISNDDDYMLQYLNRTPFYSNSNEGKSYFTACLGDAFKGIPETKPQFMMTVYLSNMYKNNNI